MKIQKKTLSILLFTFLVLLILFYAGTELFIKNYNLILEHKTIENVISKVRNIITFNQDNLNKIGRDWSEWDDTYKFVENRNSEYIKSNLLYKTFTDLYLNIIIFYNRKGEIVYGKYYDLRTGNEIPLPERFINGEYYTFFDSCLNKGSRGLNGIICDSDSNVFLLTALPILNTLGEGPRNGILVMSYRFNSDEVAKLSKLMGFKFSMSIYKPEVNKEIYDNNGLNISILNDDFVSGSVLINDINNKPVIKIESIFSRDFYKHSQNGLLFFMVYFIFAILITTLITMIFIYRLIIKKIVHFTNSIKNAGKDGKLFEKVNVNGKDEISILSNEFNSMLEKISTYMEKQNKIEKELQISNEQLSELSLKIESIREEERSKMALQLHDELGQSLTRLNLDLFYLEKVITPRLNKDDLSLFLEQIKSMSIMIDDLVVKVKKITTELRPSVLDSFGLSAAIEWQIQEVKKETNIVFNYLIEPESIVIDKERTTALFRIFQEAITNIIKHSKANTVDIYLEKDNDSIIMEIKDNGIGIKNSDPDTSHSLGIISMKERVKHFDGCFAIISSPEKGTTISVKIPIKNK
jgi:signal transduction histidine kinase